MQIAYLLLNGPQPVGDPFANGGAIVDNRARLRAGEPNVRQNRGGHGRAGASRAGPEGGG